MNKTETIAVRLNYKDKQAFKKAYLNHPDCEDISFSQFIVKMIKQGIDPPTKDSEW